MIYLVCKGIVDLHGGSISASSEGVGKGACFTIELPIASHTPNPLCESDSLVETSFLRQSSIVMGSTGCLLGILASFDCLLPARIGYCFEDCVRKRRVETELEASQKQKQRYRVQSRSFDQSLRKRSKSSSIDQEAQVQCSLVKSDHVSEVVHGEWKNNDLFRNFKRKRVLVVDDVPMNRKMLRRWLNSRFDVCTEAENGQQAVDLVREAFIQERIPYYDLITMDYQMPIMDGATAIRHIRQLGYQGVIVAVTGNAVEEDIRLLLSSGANKVMTKPLSIAIFDEFIDSL